MAATPRNYWMLAVAPDYFDVVRQRDFGVLGLTRAHKKRVQRMEPGDRVLYFVTGKLVFPATATIVAPYTEDDTPLFPPGFGGELYTYRVKTKPNQVLDDDHQIDARLIAPRMDHARKWPPELWPLAFEGLLHLVPKTDFLLLESEIKRARRARRQEHPLGRFEPGGEDFACEFDRQAARVY